MAWNNSIQFRGKANVLKAYENRKVKAWSLWVNKQFLFKYAGTNESEALAVLEDHLEMLLDDKSTAIYTLKVYDEITEVKQIKEKTEADGSFNFRLSEENNYSYRDNALQSKIAALEKQIEDLTSEEEEEEEEENIIGQIGQAMANPVIAGLVEKITGFKMPAGPVAISGIDEGQKDEMIKKAIETLKAKDPNIAQHLTKLADIANSNIDNFKYLLNLLDQISL